MIKHLSGDFETVEYDTQKYAMLYDNNENEAYHSDAQSNADENSGEASNSNSQSSADNNANNDPDYPEIPGEGEIVIHGDPSYVGTD